MSVTSERVSLVTFNTCQYKGTFSNVSDKFTSSVSVKRSSQHVNETSKRYKYQVNINKGCHGRENISTEDKEF